MLVQFPCDYSLLTLYACSLLTRGKTVGCEKWEALVVKRRTRNQGTGHPGCRGPACRNVIWDGLYISVAGPHAKYTNGDPEEVDEAVDNFVRVLRRNVSRLLREHVKTTPALQGFHLNFS